MSGKGSAPRPMPDRDTFGNNFDTIFGKKPVDTEPSSPSARKEGKDKNVKDKNTKV